MLLYPFYIFFSIIVSKKARDYFFNRDTNLRRSFSSTSIWIHASSGEFEHAKFLIKTLKKQNPHEKIIATYSSPSYLKAVKSFDLIDAYIPMPPDLKGPIASLIKKINPKIILFSRTDLWPELMHQLDKKNIPSLVFSRMERSKKTFGESLLFNLTYKKASHISFVSENDKKSFLTKFKNHPSLSVDGDPRLEEVLDRASKLEENSKLEGKTLILGSVWSEDLRIIAPVICNALKEKSLDKIIAAPHDPSPQHIKEIEKVFDGFKTCLLSKDSSFKSDINIVDTTGKLFDLYQKAHIAFVGGSFKKRVHSVIEPLSHGLPVLVGPYIDNNTEAKAYSVGNDPFVRVCMNKEDFKKHLESLLNNDLALLSEAIQNDLANFKGASIRIANKIDSISKT